MMPEQKQQRVNEIREYQEMWRDTIDFVRPTPKDLTEAMGHIDFLLSLVKSQEETHGFAPMDNLSDVCGAYISDGYCWRPRRHAIHGTVAGMGLYECNTPAQAFNPEREKKAAEIAATSMRSACVAKLRQIAADYDNVAQPNTGAAISKQALLYGARQLESLTLQEQEAKQS